MLSLGVPFVVCLTQNRVTTDGEHSIQQLRRTKACGEVEVSILRDSRKNQPARTAQMEVACCSVSIVRSKRVKSDLPDLLALNLIRNCLINKRQKAPNKPHSLKTAIDYLGELGSYRHSPSDGDYGAMVVWNGLFKLFNALDVIDRLMGQV